MKSSRKVLTGITLFLFTIGLAADTTEAHIPWVLLPVLSFLLGGVLWEALHNAPEAEPEEPMWVVNNLGELGVYVNGKAFFLYKGDNITYDENDKIPYRQVRKREFGECQHSAAQIDAGQYNGGDFYEEEARANVDGHWVLEGVPPGWRPPRA